MAISPQSSWLLLLGCVVLSACATGELRRFPLRAPIEVDPDQQPFQPMPEEYFSPFAWDAADQTIFRRLSRSLRVSPQGRAVNANALDEVPDSSWFENRIGARPMSAAEVGRGACQPEALDPASRWTITGGKPNGANPGFLIQAEDGRRYLLKFDGVGEGPRATAADVVGSRVYHAAGYFAPCNRIVYFNADILKIGENATVEDDTGHEEPMTQRHLDAILSMGIRMGDGRYRASASLFVEGKVLGPWRYQGKRDDDPNDVVAHEDRRELRGARVFAAWLNHFDSREQNTLATFIQVAGGAGYVKHYLIDFGDCLGSIWEPPMLGRRIGHAYYLDFGDVLEDFVTLGALRRPWDRASFGPTGSVFGYYAAELFEPEQWKPGYPNPAFTRMDEADAAWAARVLARFSDRDLNAIVAEAKLYDPAHAQRLTSVLKERRQKILARYLNHLSPLSQPRVRAKADKTLLCLQDVRIGSAYMGAVLARYAARIWDPPGFTTSSPLRWVQNDRGLVCAELSLRPRSSHADYGIVDLWAASERGSLPPSRVHYYALPSGVRIVGLERPDNHDAPGG